jgi:hypothetical protein
LLKYGVINIGENAINFVWKLITIGIGNRKSSTWINKRWFDNQSCFCDSGISTQNGNWIQKQDGSKVLTEGFCALAVSGGVARIPAVSKSDGVDLCSVRANWVWGLKLVARRTSIGNAANGYVDDASTRGSWGGSDW